MTIVLATLALAAATSFSAAAPPDPARDTLSPAYAWRDFPFTWAEVQAGKFTLAPVHWTRHAANPVVVNGMNARPVQLEEHQVRVYFGRSGKQGGIFYFDVDPRQPEKLLAEPVGPILAPGPAGSYDDDWVLCPEPVRLSDKHLRLYYSAKKTGSFFQKVWSLACADSYDNGQTWTKYAGNPILTTTDEPWESGAVGFSSIEHDERGWRMWYLGTDTSSNALKQVGYATSDDGLTWQRHAENPVLGVNPDNPWERRAIAVARMIRDERLIRTWYCCYPQNNTYAVGCAESIDGIHWFRSPHNPVLQGAGRGWDGQMTAYPGTVRVGDTYLMWYSGNNYGRAGLGLATAQVPRGKLVYRIGPSAAIDDSWSAWQPLSAAEPERTGYIQFAALADE